MINAKLHRRIGKEIRPMSNLYGVHHEVDIVDYVNGISGEHDPIIRSKKSPSRSLHLSTIAKWFPEVVFMVDEELLELNDVTDALGQPE